MRHFDSPGFDRIVSHLDSRRKLYLGVFALGFVGGFPIGGSAIDWLLESDGYVPEGVEVIILQPLEVILLQLRIATQIAFGIMITMIVLDISWVGKKTFPEAVAELSNGPGWIRVISTMVAITILGTLGMAYSHNVLIPFLLDYLAEDTAKSGLQSTWQLQSWVGFIAGLYFSSILGFQVPVVVTVLLRTELIDRAIIVDNRGAIWFIALFLGALISPPDPISLFLVGGPILVLLEAALMIDKYAVRR